MADNISNAQINDEVVMPRSFLVKQHETKTTEEDNQIDLEPMISAASLPRLQDEPPIPSLPPPLLKVSPRSSSKLVSKDDARVVRKLIPRSPSGIDFQSMKDEPSSDYYGMSTSLDRPLMLPDWYHGYGRHLGYKSPRDFIDTRHDTRFLLHNQNTDKKTILEPYPSYHVIHPEPIMERFPHALYGSIGYYGNSHVNLLPKYYMPAMSDSSVVSGYSCSKDNKVDVDTLTEKKINEECTTVVSPDSTQGAIQAPGKEGSNGAQGGGENKPSTAKKYRYTCDVCGKSFSRSNTLTTHKRIHTGAKPFHCEQCGRAFRQPGNLTRHRLTHTAIKPYVCPQCNKAFNRASNLHTHMRTHTNYKPFVCDFCGKGFHQKIDMKIHRYTHTGEKPHKCSKCGRGFKQLTHLTYHMRTHSDERLYKCEYCGKGFNQKGNLQAHIYGHTGERPFKCEICGKGFTLASTLNTHKRTHATKKPFDCQFCGKAFYQKNALKTHYIASHPFANGVSLL